MMGKPPVPAMYIYPEITGIPKEFMERLESLGPEEYRATNPTNALAKAHAISYLATKMLTEARVRLLLSTYVTDPILEGQTVKGLFVENKSRRTDTHLTAWGSTHTSGGLTGRSTERQ